MPFTNKGDLKTAIVDWMAKAEMSGSADDFIGLAEAKLNRLLPVVEQSAPLTGIVGSREIGVAQLAIASPTALFIMDGQGERPLRRQPDGMIAYSSFAGMPTAWSCNASTLTLDRSCAAAYPFRFHFRGRFGLAEDTATNWLLQNHPDVYLAASMFWGSGMEKDDRRAAAWASTLETGIPEVRAELGQRRRGTLMVDAALVVGPDE